MTAIEHAMDEGQRTPETRIPERNKRPGVCYAVTDEGIELPVIDLTHPAFGGLPDRAAQEEAVERYLATVARHARLPGALRKALDWLLRRRSGLLREIRDPGSPYVSGLATYRLKLGPDNLGAAYAGRVDRFIAGSAPALATRLRLRNVARLIAEALVPRLQTHPGRRLCLVNIGGGPAMDSLNALLLLRRDHPRLLDDRPVQVHVLDVDAAGPAFGGRALRALSGPGGPLVGVTATLEHHRYDWAHSEALAALAAGWDLGRAIVVCSSEGGLFVYGTDDVVVANLEAVRRLCPEETFVVGSFARVGRLSRALQASGPLQNTRPRSGDELGALVAKAGWNADRIVDNLMSFDVRLTRSRLSAAPA